jgi:metallophosphoesterase superfamily enzyme
MTRRRRLEAKHGITLEARKPAKHWDLEEHPSIHNLAIQDGVVLVASDCHYWPGIVTPAHLAFVQFAKELKPAAIILNGDVLDGARISRHPPIGWENRPNLIQELEVCQQRLWEISEASPNSAKIWNLGNHDGRFETKLASVAPEFARVQGVHLKDHFPMWKPAWSTWINDEVVVKHRYKGGIHATHNNTVSSGKSIVTGHLHSLKVTPYSDYNGTRYGVDTGTMAPIYGPQTSDYCETNPVNWRQGFVVLTFHKGQLLWPEVVHVLSANEIEFRGRVHTIEEAE